MHRQRHTETQNIRQLVLPMHAQQASACWLFGNDPSCACQLIGYCSLVAKPSVLACRLLIVMAFTNRFPVVHIPEQAHVALVGDDMIHDCCRGQPSHPPALGAQGIAIEKQLPRSAPPRAVTPRSRGTAPGFQLPAFLNPVPLAPGGVCQGCTDGISAWVHRSQWAHAVFLFS